MRYIWRQQLHKTYTTCACLHSKKKKERKKKLKTGKLEKKKRTHTQNMLLGYSCKRWASANYRVHE